jgi:hypothetical protein
MVLALASEFGKLCRSAGTLNVDGLRPQSGTDLAELRHPFATNGFPICRHFWHRLFRRGVSTARRPLNPSARSHPLTPRRPFRNCAAVGEGR